MFGFPPAILAVVLLLTIEPEQQKAMRWQIYTCAMFLYIVYICCYKTASRTLVSIFWLQNLTYFRAL